MTITWDLYAKDLLKERPQDFVELVLPGARYITRHESQYQMREIRLDRLIEVEYEGERFLINVEIQASKDKKIGRRLLRYSLEAMDEYELPVLSCVIYLQKIGKLKEPPLCVELRAGKRRLLWFDYISIELTKWTVEELRETNLLGVLPLFILSKGGRTFEVLDEVVTRLQEANDSVLLALARLFADQVFTSQKDQLRLSRRFAMLRNIEEGPTFKRLIAQGRLLEAQQNIKFIVQKRFPSLSKMVKAKLDQITEIEQLQEISLNLSLARTAKEFKQYFLELMESLESGE